MVLGKILLAGLFIGLSATDAPSSELRLDFAQNDALSANLDGKRVHIRKNGNVPCKSGACESDIFIDDRYVGATSLPNEFVLYHEHRNDLFRISLQSDSKNFSNIVLISHCDKGRSHCRCVRDEILIEFNRRVNLKDIETKEALKEYGESGCSLLSAQVQWR